MFRACYPSQQCMRIAQHWPARITMGREEGLDARSSIFSMTTSNSSALWRNDGGAISMWETDGTRNGALWVAPGWQIEGIGNYDGDATADILWRHVNGAVISAELDGINALVGNASSDWYIPSQGSGASMAGAAAPKWRGTAWTRQCR